MSGTIHKEYRPLLRRVEELGCTVTQTKRNHLCIRLPDGVGTVIASGTPGDRRALTNTISQLRRAGLDV